VVDLLSGEELPSEIVAALTDDTVIKWAFNAQFERICLSRWLRDHGGFDNTGYSIPQDTVGNYLDPAAWHCTMIWSATMGLPLSLEGVGAVLGLDKQKLSEGKDLIKYFCQPCAPTKTNGGRTRNLPMHAPDKWAAFKRYNCRDDPSVCLGCGKPITQREGIKRVKFCCPSCRQAWWNSHPEKVNRKAIYSFTCACCGKPFTAYGNRGRKY
jgi:hypothetical protein